MIFYVDNKVNQKKEFTYEELIARFLADEKAYNNLLQGQPFERCFLNTIPGVPEPIVISSEDWYALWNEFNKQVPNPEYQF